MSMSTREGRPLIFLAVLFFHIAIVLLAMRATLQQVFPSTPVSEPLLLLLLPNRAHTIPDVATAPNPAGQLQMSTSSKAQPSKPPPDGAITLSPEELPPKTDWEREAELAAKNATTNADNQSAYRNLSALSPEQLSWVRQNHLEPAEPGIPWKYRRVEVTEGGFPIIHINDHCVAIPFLMMMVFCKIGHIEPKGDLFEHMRDPHNR